MTELPSMQSRLQKQWLHWRQPDGWHFSAGAAVVIGLSAALGVALFKLLIDLFSHLFGALTAWLAPLGPLAIVLAPVLGGLLVSLLSRYWIGPERHHGVAGVIESVALAGGRLRFWRVPGQGAGVGALDRQRGPRLPRRPFRADRLQPGLGGRPTAAHVGRAHARAGGRGRGGGRVGGL
jgi:MFS family permease